MNIINIVDNISNVNQGIWKAAISTAKQLLLKYGVESYIIYPDSKDEIKLTGIVPIPVTINRLRKGKQQYLRSLLKEHGLSVNNTVVVSHGCWQFPTIWGNKLKKMGYSWVYVPQGMLEPWSLNQKKIIKLVYGKLIEFRYSKNANCIRAVGTPEMVNLNKLICNSSIELIPNGIEKPSNKINENIDNKHVMFLFMARLHHKKGVLPLVKAWKSSLLFNCDKYKLVIAGPDHGELQKLNQEIRTNSQNIEYVGAIYGEEKHELLNRADFFVLPSFTEGFPTSVVEAMGYGSIPIISDGCNFPEAFDKGLAIKTGTDVNSIFNALNASIEEEVILNLNDRKKQVRSFINENYTLEKIAEMQYNLYLKLLQK